MSKHRLPIAYLVLSLSLSLTATGCADLFDLPDVTLVDGGAAPQTVPAPRNYQCGYAMPGFHCDNGRSHVSLVATDMATAIAMCSMAKPMPSFDYCHVIDVDGLGADDAAECAAASGSWRPGNNCCNFEGTLSCP